MMDRKLYEILPALVMIGFILLAAGLLFFINGCQN
jgi:hypothetical protein